MTNSAKTTLGIVITILIYSISVLMGKVVKIPIDFIPSAFMNQFVMLTLSGISIYYFQSKGLLNFSIKPVKIKLILKTILTAVIVFIAVSITASIAIKIICGDIPKGPNPFMKYTPLQYFIFLAIIAPITEEYLFRGFLLNMLEPLKSKGIKLFRIKLNVSVLISGVLFGMAHILILTSGADLPFVFRILFFTTIVGIMNGYLQEKHENNTLVPIIAHITINTIGFLISLLSLS
jgi:membrane protease YdiL (CAAX protease family)